MLVQTEGVSKFGGLDEGNKKFGKVKEAFILSRLVSEYNQFS